MKTLLLIFLLVIILLLDSYFLSLIGDLLSQKSDITVIVGVLILFLVILINYYLINKIFKQLSK